MARNEKIIPQQLLLFPETETEHQKKQRIVKILESELAAPVKIALTRNRSSVLTCRRQRGRVEIKMHQVFLSADRRVLKAVADLIRKGSQPARRVIDAYLRLHRGQIQRAKKARAVILNPGGKVYDLEKILKDLKRKYNLHPRGVKITWAYSRIRRRQRSIRLGSFHQDEKLIRVHASLDNPSVPRYFVEYIVYHELLHALVKPEERPGRRNFHPRQYHALEKKFEHFKQARKFEKYITAHWLD